MSVRENLIKAKALIEDPKRWGKGDGFIAPRGCFCAESVCHEVAKTAADYIVKLAMWDALEKALPEPWRTKNLEEDMAVHHYNDAPETTHTDIMALFARAIEASE